MAKVEYKVRTFNTSEASTGVLCAMVKTTSLPYSILCLNGVPVQYKKTSGGASIDLDSSVACKAIGVTKTGPSGTYLLTFSNNTYSFNSKGECVTPLDSRGYYLTIAELADNVSTYGSTGDADVAQTRAGDGSIEDSSSYSGSKQVVVDSLNARDQFAAQALRGMLSHISNPAELSLSDMAYYSEAAYQWASTMMNSATKARTKIVDEGASTRHTEDIGYIESTTDKLLNNLIYELAQTNMTVSSGDIWEKVVVKDWTNLVNAISNAATTIANSLSSFASSVSSRITAAESKADSTYSLAEGAYDAIPDISGIESTLSSHQSTLDNHEGRISDLESDVNANS